MGENLTALEALLGLEKGRLVEEILELVGAVFIHIDSCPDAYKNAPGQVVCRCEKALRERIRTGDLERLLMG